jgi:hypothetical protein
MAAAPPTCRRSCTWPARCSVPASSSPYVIPDLLEETGNRGGSNL